MLHLNVASISLHLNDLKILLSILDHPFDIIALSETKILNNCEPLDNIFIEGYKYEHTPTKTEKGGVCIFYKDRFNFKRRDDLSKSIENIAESVFLEFQSPNKKNVLIGCIYRHPNSISEFVRNFFENLLVQISQEKNKKCAILGDLNINLLDIENDEKSFDFYTTLTAFGFRPLILQPTRVQTTSRSTSATLIDNIFVNDIENTCTGGNITTHISDHFPQFCFIPNFLVISQTTKNSQKYGRSFKNFSQNEFNNEIKNVNWELHFHNKNSDQCLNFLITKIDLLLDEMAPIKV